MAIPFIQTAFSAGEISPALFGHVDLAKIHVAAATARNMFVSYRGGLKSRAGTAYVLRAKQPGTSLPPRLITFQFSLDQGYALEFGDQYMRAHYRGAPVLEPGQLIATATNADPCVLSVAGHGFNHGDWVFIDNCQGMTQLNNAYYIIVVLTPDTFWLAALDGTPTDSSAFGVYVPGTGTVARVFTLATPYAAADLARLKFTQSADVMSLTHPSYPPADLARISAYQWTVTPIQIGSTAGAPPNCVVSPTVNPNHALAPPTLPAAYAYVVTAVSGTTGQESVASPIGNATNSVDIAVTAGSLIIDWTPVAGAGSYNIYKAPTSYNSRPGDPDNADPVPAGAPFGYIGTSVGAQFVDSNIIADFQQVPPLHRDPFAPGQILFAPMAAYGAGYTFAAIGVTTATGSGLVADAVIVNNQVVAVIIRNNGQNYLSTDTLIIAGDGAGAVGGALITAPLTGTYPGCVAYFQQRRVYAASTNNPDTYWMSQPGAFLNFDSSIPVTDSDAITGTPWSQQVNGIQALVQMPAGLVALTGSGVWQVTGTGSTAFTPVAITPSNQQAQPQPFIGCAPFPEPIPIYYDILYVQSLGSLVYSINYNFFFNTYTPVDLTQLSGHLFIGYQIVDWAWCQYPYKVAWVVRDDGSFVSLTYLKEQEVYGWARHDTYGSVYSMTAVGEPPIGDALYMVVARFIPSGQAYYIECMNNRVWNDVEDAWCVDSALALARPAPAAALNLAPIALGASVAVASVAVFVPGHVGFVIRACGAIAVITAYISPQLVSVNIIRAATQAFTDLPQGQPPFAHALQGAWTMTAPVSTVTGLQHLAGLTVTGLADGIPITPRAVSASGSVALDAPASAVVIGLAFQAQYQSVYADPGTQPTAQGRRKDILAATVRLEASAGLKAATNQVDGSTTFPPALATTWSPMVPIPDQGATYTTPGGATATQLFTGDARVNLFASWRKPGQFALQQDNPLPMAILAVIPEGMEGDTPEEGYAPQPSQQGGARGPGPWMLRG